MTLRVHRAADARLLVGALVDVIARDRKDDDAFTPEVISVPSRGIERWISQELAQRLGAGPGKVDGIAANLAFPTPATLIGWAMRSLDGTPADLRQRRPHPDPWSPERLAWTLLEVADGMSATDLGPFGAYLQGSTGQTRRLSALRHVARLFSRYGIHRPALIRAWQAGEDIDGTGQPLDASAAWQPHLWRAARQQLGPSFAETAAATAAHLAQHPVPGLPDRVAIYGLTAQPATYAEVFDGLAGQHDVHLFLLHPSPGLWARMPQIGTPLRADDPTTTLPHHPLLTSWARDSRELQLVLAGRGADHPLDPQDGDASTTLLARLQHDIRTDTAPEATPPLTLALDPATGTATDDSVTVHGCHGTLRQVEVLRDVILGLMSDDPNLQPRDIVVMCPDVEAFAPLIQAVFGADTSDRNTSADGLPNLRVRLADRALRQVNPLLRTIADVLELPDGRFEASTALDLLRRGPVMARFGLDIDDLDTIAGWIADVDIRWGLDATHRQRHGVPTDANTWRVGLRRLLLGVAVPEEGPRTIGGVLPHDDVEGTAVDLAGRLAEFVDRIGLLITHLCDARPIRRWVEDLRTAATLLCDASGPHAWQAIQLGQLLDDLLARAGGPDAPDTPVGLPELRDLLADDLRGRPTRANHRSGDLTVCTLVPMRSVPYRVVCLLGIDDGAFPRRSVPFGDDLIARHPHVGDHDARTEDRQQLLDALMAAGEHLVITYRAHDERNGAPLPAAVPVAELLDVIDATATLEPTQTTPARSAIVRTHPLHAADPRAFDADAPFGFDPLALAGARARARGPRPPTPFTDTLPPPVDLPATVEWAELGRFLQDPVGGYLRERLDVRYPRDEGVPEDLLGVELDALERWEVGSRLLESALRGDLERWADAERARGSLPAGQMGEAALATIRETLTHVCTTCEAAGLDTDALLDEPTARMTVDLDVDGTTIFGAVERVGEGTLLRIDYGAPKPKRRLKVWLDWLILQAMGEGRPAVLITSGTTHRPPREILTRYPADLDREDAMDRLRVLLDLYRRGRCEPLPLFVGCSGAFVERLDGRTDRGQSVQDSAFKDAANAWTKPFGDGSSQAVRTVFAGLGFDDICQLPAAPDEQGEGWYPGNGSRFARLAWRLWAPVFTDRLPERVGR